MEFIPCIRCIPWFTSTTNSIFAAAPTHNEQTQNFGVLSFINRSSSTIVFNQRHRWVAHHTPTPCEKIYPTSHSLQSFNFCLDDFHATLPNSQSHWPMIFRPPRITSPQFSSSILFILFRHHHSLPSNSNHFAHILPPPACGTNIQNIRRLGDIE